MKPRVVILSAFLTPFRSGAEACAEEVPPQLAHRYDFTIVTARMRRDLPKRDQVAPRSGSRSPGEGVTVLRVGLGLPIDKWLYPFLAPFVVRRLKPDIAHAILETFAGLALMACRWTCPAAKRLLTLQTTNRNFLKGQIIRSAHRVTAISKALASIAGNLGRHDVTVIPNGIDAEAIRTACGKHRKIPGRMLFVGRLEPMKGVDVLLRAISGQWSVVSGSHLHIVGDGSRRSALETLAAGLGIADRVEFRGRLDGDALLREYAEAEIFCGLSRSEALGNVFLEAQAAGCAVVATKVGGIPEIVEDGVTGLLVPAGDDRAAAEAIGRLLREQELREEMGRAGIALAGLYDWHTIAEQYAETYRTILL